MNENVSTNSTILLCEDEGIIAMDLQGTLEACGYGVAGIAKSGAEAISMAKNTNPDIALMDIGLNGSMNGIEAATLLRRSYDIPTVFLTGNTDLETFLEAKSSDPLGFLLKPIEASHLQRTIELALQLHKKEKALKSEIKTNSTQVERLLKCFPVHYDNEGKSSFGSMVRIAGGTSHHLNNMLFDIQANLDWLSSCPTVGSYEKRYIRSTTEACVKATEFIKKLSWSAGQGKLQMTIVSIKDFLERAISEVRQDVDCTVSFSGGDYKVLIAEDMVSEAFKGLIRNAQEADPKGKTISVTTFMVSPEEHQKKNAHIQYNDCVCIEVKDTGKGFPASLTNSIVEPFVTTHAPSEKKGLGLSIARGVCFAHEGWFSISSVENVGTVAKMFLPMEENKGNESGYH